jgi:hypothetical protein
MTFTSKRDSRDRAKNCTLVSPSDDELGAGTATRSQSTFDLPVALGRKPTAHQNHDDRRSTEKTSCPTLIDDKDGVSGSAPQRQITPRRPVVDPQRSGCSRTRLALRSATSPRLAGGGSTNLTSSQAAGIASPAQDAWVGEETRSGRRIAIAARGAGRAGIRIDGVRARAVRRETERMVSRIDDGCVGLGVDAWMLFERERAPPRESSPGHRRHRP